ncbi:hypothetical protein [Sphaerimonospora mesophila]|uniref:hypothetical protein n=1 Tax=Sphaerimonospora mesophila TaxID=37483 RepID=UPI0006E34ADD
MSQSGHDLDRKLGHECRLSAFGGLPHLVSTEVDCFVHKAFPIGVPELDEKLELRRQSTQMADVILLGLTLDEEVDGGSPRRRPPTG